MQKLAKAVELILDGVLFLLFAAIFFTVLLQVVARFMPTVILPWTEEIVRIGFVWIIGVGAPLAIKYNEFARVDVILQIVPLRWRLILELFSMFMVSIFCFIAGYTALPMIAVGAIMTTVALQLPMYVMFIAIPVCLFLAGVAGIFKSVEIFLDILNPTRVEIRHKAAAEALAEETRKLEKLLEAEGASLSGNKGE